MNSLDKQYLDLLRDIKENGTKKETRNGVTYSIFGRQIRHDMSEGFPLLTTKKVWFKGIRTELEWFLDGSTNIQPLVKKGNNIWVGDAYKRYVNEMQRGKHGAYLSEDEFIEKIKNDDEFAEKWGDMGPIYGKQWREFTSVNKYGVSSVDQIQKLINDLWDKPDSRRLMVNAWNPVQLDDMILHPCHYGFQVWTRELTLEERANAIPRVLSKEKLEKYTKSGSLYVNEVFNNERIPERGISLAWNQRSVDTPLGLPFNIASYGLLLKMIANEVMMLPLDLIGNLGDTHIYENQMDGIEKQLKRDGHPLPEVIVMDGIYSRGDHDIRLKNYESEDKINFPLSN